MRVAILAPPWYPVPPPAYGGIEAVVALLADGLVEAGVDVTLFASGDSRSLAEIDAVFTHAPSEQIGRTHPELDHVLQCLARAHEFDVVHDHTGVLGIALLGATGVPVVHTVHGPLTGSPGALYAKALRLPISVGLISLSLNQRRPQPRLPWIANVPNAIDFGRYPLRAAKDDYLLFLGRMCPDKGVHHAIEVARAAGLPLRIAAKCREENEFTYFERRIAPLLGPDVEWIGEVAHDEKVELLSRARALLFPIDWEEPFGLVMIEALACGTPVVATRRGAVPEVIDDGTTGFVVDDVREMPAAVARTHEFDAATIRAVAEDRFTPERLVTGYLAAYETARGSGANGGSQVDVGERLLRHMYRNVEHRDLADRSPRTAVVGVAVHDEIGTVGADGSGSLPEPRKAQMDSGSPTRVSATGE